MRSSKFLTSPHLPWLPLPKPKPKPAATCPPPISNAALRRHIASPTATLHQTLNLFSLALRHPAFHPDLQTLKPLVSLLASRRRFLAAELVLDLVRRRHGLVPGPSLLLPLIAAYSAAGFPSRASRLFLSFPHSDKVFSFLLDSLLASAQFDVAVALFSKAADLGFPIKVRYYNVLIKGLCDGQKVEDGITILKEMLERGVSLDVITFSTMIGCLGKESRVLEANALFGKMVVMGVKEDLAWYRVLFGVYWRNGVVEDVIRVLWFMELDRIGHFAGEVEVGVLSTAMKKGLMGLFVG